MLRNWFENLVEIIIGYNKSSESKSSKSKSKKKLSKKKKSGSSCWSDENLNILWSVYLF